MKLPATIKIYKIIGLTLILLIAFTLRFYKLEGVPNGLSQDETSIGYNAYSILKTGRDEHGVYLPQNFKAFGEYKLPGYIYASVSPIAIFGLTSFSIRFVSAISGFLSVIIIFFLTKTIIGFTIGEKKESWYQQSLPQYLPYLTALLLAINPWHLHFSRAAFEVMLANFFILCGVWLLILGINKSKFKFIGFSIIFLSLSMYTYNIARVFTPLFCLILLILFRKKILSLPKWFYIASIVILVVFLFPFILGAVKHGGADSTSGTLIFTSAKVQSSLQEIRSYFIGLPAPITKTLFNYWSLTGWQYVNNVFSHLSPSFYFISGSDRGNNSIGTTAQWYIFELPLVLWGIISLLRSKSITAKIIFAWIISLILVASFTREPPQATRTFFLIFPITFCSGLGLANLIRKIYLFPNKNLRYIVSLVCVTVFSYYISLYFASYYVRFPIYYAKDWRTGDRDVSYFLKNHQGEYDKVIIDKNSGFMYTSLLVYLKYPPENFQNGSKWVKEDSEGFTKPEYFGKYEIREIDWSKDINYSRALIITTVDKKPLNIPSLMTIYYPKRPVVFNVGQEIIRYPVEEIAYVLIDINNAKKKTEH